MDRIIPAANLPLSPSHKSNDTKATSQSVPSHPADIDELLALSNAPGLTSSQKNGASSPVSPQKTTAPPQQSIDLYKNTSKRISPPSTSANTQSPIANQQKAREELWGEVGKNALSKFLELTTIGLEIGICGILLHTASIVGVAPMILAISTIGVGITCFVFNEFFLKGIYEKVGEQLGKTLEKNFPPSKTGPAKSVLPVPPNASGATSDEATISTH